MDFSRNVVVKEDHAFVAADASAQVQGGEQGLFARDTRYLSRYLWRFTPALQPLLVHSPQPDGFVSHHGLIAGHQQEQAVSRRFTLAASGFSDELLLESVPGGQRELVAELEVAGDFADLFEVRGWSGLERKVEVEREEAGLTLRYRSDSGGTWALRLTFSRPALWQGERARFVLEAAPGLSSLRVEGRFGREGTPSDGTGSAARRPAGTGAGQDREYGAGAQGTGRGGSPPEAPGYRQWRELFADLPVPPGLEGVVRRAVDDLRALLLFTEEGPVPAAGIPWYVAPFGRDSLLAAALLLPRAPAVAAATLRHLARHQGRKVDPFRAEAPGKIMHELRQGELARLGLVPHSPYYGTVDATPLFVVLLERYWRATGDLGLVRELQGSWEAALRWLVESGDLDGDGFLEFSPDPADRGLRVQSWKDSPDSMSHRDGSLARGNLAVCEVQGYAYDALAAAAAFYRALGDGRAAAAWGERAAELARAFDEAFWLEELGTYALALDGEKRPLAVLSSDAGHLLWSGIVPPERAQRLTATLFGPALWSGWGFRTLGSGERRYNPVSYHNGSVWPHDSTIVALGLARYGYRAEALRVRRALFELALTQPDLRLPELVGGYDREEGYVGPVPPVPYPVACRPQAWDAAAVVGLLGL